MPKPPSEPPATSQTAIEAALSQNWKQAIDINNRLIKQIPEDVDAHNRLGFAYLKSGQFTAAKRIFDKVLKIDPYNQIALKNSKKLTTMKRKNVVTSQGGNISPLLFLEEPGVTKIVALVNPAPSQVLSGLSSGIEVILRAKNHCVEIRTQSNAYLGALPDDLSFRLLKLMEAGNSYKAHTKSIGKNSLTVILREITRGKRFGQQPSFSATQSFAGVLRPTRTYAEAPDVTPTGEEDSLEAESGIHTRAR